MNLKKKPVSDKAVVYNKQRNLEAIPGAFDALTPRQQKRLRKQINKLNKKAGVL